MIAYKANTVRWTHENDYQTTDNTVIGLLYRNPNKGAPWTIAYEIEEGTGAVKSYMVNKNTVEEVEVKKVTDRMRKVYWYEEKTK